MCRLLAAILVVLPFVAVTHAQEKQNLAAGKPCAFAPTPNYDLTAKGDTDAADLTDGRLTERADQCMWFESHAVGWSYLPILNLRVDLGAVQPIDEVVIRFLGGGAQAGICAPTFIRLCVSDDDVAYHRVAEYSRWQPGDDQRFGVPSTDGKAWVHPYAFSKLMTRGRYVGFVVGGTGLTCSDELYVYKGDHDPAAAKFAPDQTVDFSVSRPELAFLKPFLVLPTGIASPQPYCLLDSSGVKRQVTAHFELPAQVQIAAPDLAQEKLPEGRTRYSLPLDASGASVMPRGRLYVRSSLPAGTVTDLRYWLDDGEGKSQATTLPLRIVDMPPAPRCRRMMLAMGWWSLADTIAWPDGLQAHRAVGLNTLSTFGVWMPPDDAELWAFAEEGRKQGFRMLNVDSTWHRMIERHKDDKSIYCQFADGTTGTQLCPSYRGPWYAEDLARVAEETARLKADYLSTDVELWNWRGPVDAEKCTRCQADKQASGIEKWEDWKLQKGYEMWRDLHDRVEASAAAAGLKPVEIGCYDWRPGHSYQFFWPFDRLYQAKLLHNSQVSTYTPLLPNQIALIGDEAREDRKLVPKTEGLPWLTPGDAGSFTAEDLRCAMLECFLNGSRGIHFWSSRYWDGEYLLAYNQAVREVAPVEDIIVDGALYDRAQVAPPARVSGMIRGNDIALLVADYTAAAPKPVTVTLQVPAVADVVRSISSQKLCDVKAGQQTICVPLGEHRSSVILIRAR